MNFTMTQTIQLDRAMLYFRRYAFENAKAYMLLLLAVAAFLALWYGLYFNFSNPALFSERSQVAHYFVILFLGGCLSAGMLFAELGSKPKAVYHLLIPASTLEKFLTRLIFGVLLFFVGCSLVFWIINTVSITIANDKFGTPWSAISLFRLNDYTNPFFDGRVTEVFSIYFPAQAIFILCSVYFKKHSVFKAIVAVGILWVGAIVIFLLMTALLPVGAFRESIDAFEVFEPNGDNKIVALPAWHMIGSSVYFRYLITPLLWCVAFLRLKEKEI